ncbi:WAT1-related protein [Cucumis melo var. makuwa]|uniref:WAT1-related protein n=1 Tax=Cucumis melo var. makuwa TaxID=1194695 RepID=A0A5A7TXY8_CUCMM|nr:WAT1-related protein [Cucumis melo var. makuwa]TYK18974.1 WAT1-related protein [Cucumis melo var. makuwa]
MAVCLATATLTPTSPSNSPPFFRAPSISSAPPILRRRLPFRLGFGTRYDENPLFRFHYVAIPVANCTRSGGDTELDFTESIDCVGTAQDVECVVSPTDEDPSSSIGVPLELGISSDYSGGGSVAVLEKAWEFAVLVSPFFFWGTAMVAMKEVLPRSGPFFVSAFRLIPAGFLLVAFAAFRGRPFPSGFSAWISIILFALVDATFFQGFLAQGLQRTSAGGSSNTVALLIFEEGTEIHMDIQLHRVHVSYKLTSAYLKVNGRNSLFLSEFNSRDQSSRFLLKGVDWQPILWEERHHLKKLESSNLEVLDSNLGFLEGAIDNLEPVFFFLALQIFFLEDFTHLFEVQPLECLAVPNIAQILAVLRVLFEEELRFPAVVGLLEVLLEFPPPKPPRTASVASGSWRARELYPPLGFEQDALPPPVDSLVRQPWSQELYGAPIPIGVIIDSQPLTVAVLAAFLFGESLGLIGAAGLVLGVFGLLLLEVPSLTFDANSFSLWGSGEWWMFLAAQSMAVGTVMVRWVSKYSDPIMATGWHMVIGGLPLLMICILNHDPAVSGSLKDFTTNDILALLYASIFGSAVSYGSFFYSATKGSLTKLSSLTFLTPMFASVFGFLYLGETFSPIQLVGAVVTVVAIYAVNYGSSLE